MLTHEQRDWRISPQVVDNPRWVVPAEVFPYACVCDSPRVLITSRAGVSPRLRFVKARDTGIWSFGRKPTAFSWKIRM